MSASIDICLPGIASSVKRAATSATRSEPLATTMNCTTRMMTNITAPTMMLPCAVMLPSASMTPPAVPCVKMLRVAETLKVRRKTVVRSRMVG